MLLMFMRVLYNAWLITDCINVSDGGFVSGTNVLSFKCFDKSFIELVFRWKCLLL